MSDYTAWWVMIALCLPLVLSIPVTSLVVYVLYNATKRQDEEARIERQRNKFQ